MKIGINVSTALHLSVYHVYMHMYIRIAFMSFMYALFLLDFTFMFSIPHTQHI